MKKIFIIFSVIIILCCNGTYMDSKKLIEAIKSNNVIYVKKAIESGIDINKSEGLGSFGVSPLHWACETGNLEIVKLLVENGARINSISEYNDTPLDVAERNNHADIIRYLKEKGAMANSKTELK